MAATRALSSCAAKEITSLSLDPDPTTSLLSLLKGMEGTIYNYKTNLNLSNGTLNLPAFLVFIGCVNKGGNPTGTRAVSYGPDFAALLQKENLGTVLESEEVENPLYPPPHGVKMWVWTPILEKVQAWYDAADPTVLERKEKAAEATRHRMEEQKRLDKEYYDRNNPKPAKEPLKAKTTAPVSVLPEEVVVVGPGDEIPF